jgi:hypothetical protein
VLRLSAYTTGFFLRDERDILSSLRRAGESWSVEIALIKANSSCLTMILRQGLSEKIFVLFLLV